MYLAFFIFLISALSLHAQWTPAQKSLVQEILPSAQESAWSQIKWRTNLWEARREASDTGKPIYLWEMDGHPLGCV